MNIILNGEPYRLEGKSDLKGLLTALELNPDIVSVHVNGKAVGKDDIPATELQENDKVEILLFMGGGF